MKYRIFDSVGKFIKSFPTYIQALNFKYAFGNKGWYIIQNSSYHETRKAS